jgi:hypothetical protein
MCESKTVRKVTFTGSTRVAKLLYRMAASTIKKCARIQSLLNWWERRPTGFLLKQEAIPPLSSSMTQTSTWPLKVHSLGPVICECADCLPYLFWGIRCDCLQIPRHWTNVCLREPHLRPIQCLRRICVSSRGASCSIQSR